MGKKIMKRIKLIATEAMNIITNVLVPLASLVVIILESIPVVPIGWVKFAKVVEYWLFQAFGTLEQINERLEE